MRRGDTASNIYGGRNDVAKHVASLSMQHCRKSVASRVVGQRGPCSEQKRIESERFVAAEPLRCRFRSFTLPPPWKLQLPAPARWAPLALLDVADLWPEKGSLVVRKVPLSLPGGFLRGLRFVKLKELYSVGGKSMLSLLSLPFERQPNRAGLWTKLWTSRREKADWTGPERFCVDVRRR